MISFRQHVVTLVAVFLALAIGVVLGGGPLSEVGRDALTSTSAQPRAGSGSDDTAFGDAFATASNCLRASGSRLSSTSTRA